MSKSSEAVKRWRIRTKHRLIEAMGGKCVCCGYSRCADTLDFHHKNPIEKEKSLGGLRATVRSWMKIIEEVKKCVLVCANCHREIHAGIRNIPESAAGFDARYELYKKFNTIYEMDNCPVCGKQKPSHLLTCSLDCGRRKSWSVEWEKIDLERLLGEKSINQIANDLGISRLAVRKRMKKLGLIPK